MLICVQASHLMQFVSLATKVLTLRHLPALTIQCWPRMNAYYNGITV